MPSNEYDVNPDALGVDVATSNGALGGDLLVTAGGDIEVVQGIENLKLAIFRRLLTPYGALSVFVLDADGVIKINEDYGNKAFQYLSEPLSNVVVSQVRDCIVECLGQEERITVSDVIPNITPNNGEFRIVYRIDYVVVGSVQMQSLALMQSNGQLEVS